MNECTHYFDKRESDSKDYCTLCGIELFEWATQLHAQNQQLIERINTRPAPVATVEAQTFDEWLANTWLDSDDDIVETLRKTWNAALAAHPAPQAVEVQEVQLINRILEQEGHCLQLINDNPDYIGPNALVYFSTDFGQTYQDFEGDTRRHCLSQVADHLAMQQARTGGEVR